MHAASAGVAGGCFRVAAVLTLRDAIPVPSLGQESGRCHSAPCACSSTQQQINVGKTAAAMSPAEAAAEALHQ